MPFGPASIPKWNTCRTQKGTGDLLELVFLQNFWGPDSWATDACLYRRLCSEATCKDCPIGEIDLEFRAFSGVFENAERFDLFTDNFRTFDKIIVHRLDTSR